MLSPFIVVLSALLPISFDLRPDFANIQSESGGVNGVCLTPKRIIWLIKLFLYVAFVGLFFGSCFFSLSLSVLFSWPMAMGANTRAKTPLQLL